MNIFVTSEATRSRVNRASRKLDVDFDKDPYILTPGQEDLALFSNNEALREGILLISGKERKSNTEFGKIFFGLEELPLNVKFFSERGSAVMRISNLEVSISNKGTSYFIRSKSLAQLKQDQEEAQKRPKILSNIGEH